jgi:inhibitor of KinA sporulation pathway (predicted exonuclease)
MWIRATQGHSISSVRDEELMELIPDAASLPICLHGTYSNCVDSILQNGLNKMKRNNIHLIACFPSEEDTVISGMRNSADTIITIDVEKAMAAGIPFYRSANGVILSPGLGDTGCIPPEFISEVLRRGEKSKRQKRSHTIADVIDSKLLLENKKDDEDVKKIDNDLCSKINSFGFEYEQKYSVSSKKFSHYCIVDFEATCWDKKQIDRQEIIEFPAVMVCATSLTVVNEFHSYVRPIHNPTLSEFCTSLTGITQSTVDKAPDFSVVYNSFLDYMQDFILQHRQENGGKDPNILFVSCGDWDFRTMLPKQCMLSGLVVPCSMSQWMNVKVLFSESCKSGNQKKSRLGMVGMLNELRLDLVGRHHSGIDDSRNIARILIELVNRGATLVVTSSNHGDNEDHVFLKSSRKSSSSSTGKNKRFTFT